MFDWGHFIAWHTGRAVEYRADLFYYSTYPEKMQACRIKRHCGRGFYDKTQPVQVIPFLVQTEYACAWKTGIRRQPHPNLPSMVIHETIRS